MVTCSYRNFKGKDWKFSPTLISENKSIYLLNTNICFTEDIHNYSKNFLIFNKYIGNFYNYSLITLFVLMFLLGFTNFKNKKSNKIFIFLISISIFYLFTIYLKNKLIWISLLVLYGHINSISSLILILIFDFYRHKKLFNYLIKDEDLINNYILILPIFIIFVFYKYSFFLENLFLDTWRRLDSISRLCKKNFY